MAKNKLLDLNDHLFAELERLGDEELTGDALKEELNVPKAYQKLGKRLLIMLV